SLTGQTITLTLGELPITNPVTITGLGQTALTVNQTTAASRVFNINAAVAVTISDLAVSGGSVAGNGGGILNTTVNLTLQRVTVRNHTASGGFSGGGVASTGAGAVLTIQDCTFSGNTAATGSGGGIFNDSTTSNATVTNSLITNNKAGDNANGAGIDN